MLIQNGRVQISITITNKSESFSIQKVIRILFYAEKQAGKLETGWQILVCFDIMKKIRFWLKEDFKMVKYQFLSVQLTRV